MENIFNKNLGLDILYGNVYQENTGIYTYPDELTFDFFFHDNICHNAAFIKRKLFDHVGKYNEDNHIDYNAGNPTSIRNMLKKIGVSSVITSSKEEIACAEKLILPGVGSFDYGMGMLNLLHISEIIKEKTLFEKLPILGICPGAQLMGLSSEEGQLPGL